MSIIYIILVILYLLVFIFLFYSGYAIIKGAPFVPTRMINVKKMIELAELKNNEIMMDLGSGDGRIVLEAAKSGIDCIGVEINPFLFWLSKVKAHINGLPNVRFIREDLWQVNLSKVDVLTIFFIHTKMNELQKKIKKEMKPGSRVISSAFRFQDWQPEAISDKIYVYRV